MSSGRDAAGIMLGGVVVGVAAIAGLALVMGFMVAVAVVNGYVLSCLWHWFVATQFGFPELTVLQSVGLGLIASFMTHQLTTKPDGETLVAYIFVRPGFVLLFGYIIHGMM
jgi:hypothetical protein